MKLYETKEQRCADEVLAALDAVATRHIYFELLWRDWRERLEEEKTQAYKNIVKLLPRKKLAHIPANIHTMQEQIKMLFAHVLDLSPKEPVQRKMVRYYNAKGGDSLNTFRYSLSP